jgi:hypothetical protein
VSVSCTDPSATSVSQSPFELHLRPVQSLIFNNQHPLHCDAADLLSGSSLEDVRCILLPSVTKSRKRTTPGIPTWSPTVVLTGPEHA